MIANDPWDSAENARSYAAFARTYSTYRETSQDLVALARLALDAHVVDLACGTGVTTEAVLAALGASGRVVAADASQAMLDVARSAVRDRRVRWLSVQAECLDARTIGPMDAVLCNSAIWQTDIPATVVAVGRVLRPGGRFVFNVGAEMLADHADEDQSSDPLIKLMESFAAREYGWAPAPARRTGPGRRELSENWLLQVLGNAGFGVAPVQVLTYRCSLEEQRAWLSIPIFTVRSFGGLSYDQRMAALDHAYCRIADGQNGHAQVPSRWVAFAATRDHP